VNQKDLVTTLINCLTSNLDIRQELWVHYLSGQPITALIELAQKLKSLEDNRIFMELNLESFKVGDSDKLLELMSHFTEYDQSIMSLIVIGFSIYEIAVYKGTSVIRIIQTLNAIKYNPYWIEYNTK
jgi:hypothetical protein